MALEHSLLKMGICENFSGVLTVQEIAATVQRFFESPEFDQFRYVIFNFTNVQKHELVLEQVEEVAASSLGAAFSNPRVLVAIVTTDATLSAIVMRCIDGGVIGYPARVFKDLDEACSWVMSHSTSLSETLRVRHNMSPRSMYAKQDEQEESGSGATQDSERTY